MKACSLLIAIAFWAQAGHAKPEEPQSAAFDEVKAPVPKAALSNGSGTGVGISIPQISVKSEVAGESVKLTIGKTSEYFRATEIRSFTVSVTAPFNKDRGEGFLLTDFGLPTTVSTEIGLSFSSMPGFDEVARDLRSNPVSDIDNEVRKRCYEKNQVPDDKIRTGDDPCNKNASLIVADLGVEDKVGQLVAGVAISAETATQLNQVDNKIVARYKKYVEERSISFSSLSYHALSFNASVGGDKYNYRNPLTLGKLDRKQTLFSFGSSFSYIPNISKPWGYFFGGEYRRAYELPDAETRCPAVATGANSSTCFTSAFAPPERNIDATAFAAIRYDARVGKKETPVAFELKLAYDAKDDEWGAALPLYFINDGKGNLNGGVKFGWESRYDDFTVGFFIGTNFDFLGLF